MINRKAEGIIRDSMMNDHRALMVTGARQVGKTYSIRKVGKECFEHFVEINFIEHPEAAELFKGQTSAQDILLRLSAFTKQSLPKGKTLIFFDEIQECKEIATSIKFLVDEGSYKYVLSGSLLGVELRDIRSVPVGYLQELEMYPLDLEEFLNAIGISKAIIDNLRECYNQKRVVDSFIHNRLLEAVRLYLIVGGMPAAVQQYLSTSDLRRVYEEQRGIIQTYKWDISKYAVKDKLRIEEIFDLLPSEINAKNKRFILKELNEKARFNQYSEGFLWLKDAGVALPVYNVEEPRVPLVLSKQRNLFKLFLNDVGLLAAMYDGNIQMRILNDDLNINFGAIYENLVAQELYAHHFSIEHSLFYFNSKKQGEVDFVVEKDGEILPIEVKSGKDYERHRALSNIMDNATYNIPSAIVFCQENMHQKGRITYLPIYMTMFLAQAEVVSGIYRFDLSGL